MRNRLHLGSRVDAEKRHVHTGNLSLATIGQHVVEVRPQKSHRILAVVELRARLGVLDENLARLTGVRVLVVVAQPHARLHLVYVLTSGTTASERVPSDIGGIVFSLGLILSLLYHSQPPRQEENSYSALFL